MPRPASIQAPYARRLDRALAGINPDQRIAVVLRYYLDLPVEEIASRTGAPVGTVKSRLRLALSVIRAAYEAQARAGVVQ